MLQPSVHFVHLPLFLYTFSVPLSLCPRAFKKSLCLIHFLICFLFLCPGKLALLPLLFCQAQSGSPFSFSHPPQSLALPPFSVHQPPYHTMISLLSKQAGAPS